MATAKYGKLQVETGQTLFDYTAATDGGDQKVFTVSGKSVFSNKSGHELIVRPNGLVTGRNVLSASSTVNKVSVAACTVYIKGVLTSVAAVDSAVMPRPATAVAKINSIAISATNTVDVVEGVDGTDGVNFDDTGRGGAGQPPYIPADSVEIGQVRIITTVNDAVLASDEIFQVVGTHAERFDYPTWNVNNVGDGNSATVSAKKNAYIEFDSEIGDAIHTSDAYKLVYVRGYSPIMSDISKSVDFIPAQNSHSVSSTQIYNGTVGSSSSSLGQAGFTAMLSDGITDSLVSNEDEILTFRFYPNRNKAPYSLTQGILGISTTFPVADQIQCSATISAETKTANFSS